MGEVAKLKLGLCVVARIGSYGPEGFEPLSQPLPCSLIFTMSSLKLGLRVESVWQWGELPCTQ